MVPRKNFRLAILLLLLIVGVIAVKRSGALSFTHMIDQIAPAVPAAKHEPAFQHLEVSPGGDQLHQRDPSGKRP